MSQEENQPIEQKEQVRMSPNRRQRRHMMRQSGMFKYINRLSFFHPTRVAIRQQNMENGRKMHDSNLDAIEKMQAERLEDSMDRLKETWSDIGYNAEEIEMLEEARILTIFKDKKTYRADKKKARKLIKDATNSFRSRNNS